MKSDLVCFVVLVGWLQCSVSKAEQPLCSPENSSSGRSYIFVHGLFGKNEATFMNTSGHSFADFMRRDDLLKEGLYLEFGYPSTFFSNSYSIEQAATALNDCLVANGIFEKQQVIFVAHSMGGLVTLRALLDNSNNLEKVSLIFFYAVPQQGSRLAKLGEMVSPNKGLEQLTNDIQATIERIHSDLDKVRKEHRFSFRIACAYETRPTPDIRFFNWITDWLYGPVVDYYSAVRWCDPQFHPLDKNHIDIVKPISATDDSFVALKSEIYNLNLIGNSPVIEKVDREHAPTIRAIVNQARALKEIYVDTIHRIHADLNVYIVTRESTFEFRETAGTSPTKSPFYLFSGTDTKLDDIKIYLGKNPVNFKTENHLVNTHGKQVTLNRLEVAVPSSFVITRVVQGPRDICSAPGQLQDWFVIDTARFHNYDAALNIVALFTWDVSGPIDVYNLDYDFHATRSPAGARIMETRDTKSYIAALKKTTVDKRIKSLRTDDLKSGFMVNINKSSPGEIYGIPVICPRGLSQ